MRPSTKLCQSRPALKRRINVNEIIQILEGATPWTRPRSQADDCADARSRHRQPFAGRDAGAKVAAKEVYAALDWLGREQPFIEATLARRHLKNGALLLYDVTSTYLEGRCCELARHGYSRDHRGDRPQLVIGLMCAATAARSRSRCSKATPPIR